MLALDVRALRGRSVGPTFRADLRKSLLAHFDDVFDDDEDSGITLVGDSNFGGCGGNVLLLYTFCLVGDDDVLFDDGTGGLFDLDLSPFDTLLIELLREMDGDFETEFSRDDLDALFSGDFSGTFSKFLSGELSLESLPLLLLPLYFDIDEFVLNRV